MSGALPMPLWERVFAFLPGNEVARCSALCFEFSKRLPRLPTELTFRPIPLTRSPAGRGAPSAIWESELRASSVIAPFLHDWPRESLSVLHRPLLEPASRARFATRFRRPPAPQPSPHWSHTPQFVMLTGRDWALCPSDCSASAPWPRPLWRWTAPGAVSATPPRPSSLASSGHGRCRGCK